MSSGHMVIYRGCTPVIDSRYEGDGARTPAEAVVEAVAAAADVDPLELPPLHEYVDPDALNELFQQHERSGEADTVLSFRIDHWNVFVRADGRIRVCDGTQATDPTPVFDSPTA
ncbi:HalOD1 output domain-containing protein [Haloplanus litoreus]|uniref:HalOD1 output domain-containing protein n=1 Tax=Haloplanus litoreus TaxID=767515 RepID=A0ABD6A023_9EURY